MCIEGQTQTLACRLRSRVPVTIVITYVAGCVTIGVTLYIDTGISPRPRYGCDVTCVYRYTCNRYITRSITLRRRKKISPPPPRPLAAANMEAALTLLPTSMVAAGLCRCVRARRSARSGAALRSCRRRRRPLDVVAATFTLLSHLRHLRPLDPSPRLTDHLDRTSRSSPVRSLLTPTPPAP